MEQHTEPVQGSPEITPVISPVGGNGELRPSNGEHGEPDDQGRSAVGRVAAGGKSEQDMADATAWFLSEQYAGVKARKSFELNVSADPEHPHYVAWTVEAISRQRIRQIRRQARVTSRRNTTGDQMDETKVNLLVACEGTVDPDLDAIAHEIGAQDASSVLERRMAHKPGLIDQIAGEVLGASGYDDDDVRDVTAGKS
jgi:hypothetical protein